LKGYRALNSATDYLRAFADLMTQIEVTDRAKASRPLNEGAMDGVSLIETVKAASGKVILIGNGGSASIASHIQNDLCKAVGVRSLVFNEQPLLTALANDDGYGSIFETPIGLWAGHGDVLIAISSSGQSENILRGVRAGNAVGCQIITLSGFRADNPLRSMGDINFYVPSHSYGHVEMAHTTLLHFLADAAAVRAKSGPASSAVTP
jgi:D-sedoheptulose 7-phosphate isomerase